MKAQESGLKSEMVAEAKSKLEEFRSLRDDIEKEINLIKYMMDDVRLRIVKNLRNYDSASEADQSNSGLMFHGEHEYGKFLSFETQGLLDLFRADEVIWKNHLRETKKKQKSLDKSLGALLKKQ